VGRLAQIYGAHPLHLVLLLLSFAVAGYAALQLFAADLVGVAVWFLGAAILHDLLVLPGYLLVDRLVRGGPHPSQQDGARPWVNYVRIPLGLSALLLLVFLPSILRLSDGFEATTTLSADGYAWRWLAISAVLFALSGLAYVVSLGRAHRHTSARP
jgi:hypothetical protein